MRSVAILKINQRNPDIAHPECIPPRCWRTEVHPNRNERGVHYADVKLRMRGRYDMLTFAKRLFTSRYKNRPNNSLRIRIATRRLPRINAPVYLRGYVQILKIARVMPAKFRTITSKKNFLGALRRQLDPELISSSTNRYVLNHRLNLIHRLALFCIRLLGGGR
jgi:hypothetical protein